ncbi:hypothetical protein F5Y01DRAFT_312368 [Xylaria sp. FL0043]|nr:hypothetical protein F5Y01DRAFT_312368 [Xylaria sp. FL0043]
MGILFSKPKAPETAEALRKAGLHVLGPDEPEYEERNKSYWSNSAKLSLRHILAPHGRVIDGGREGNVGVAGLILGGGHTFYTARHGFACDNVMSFEVVLADGRIVTASAGDAQNSEPVWALKGGSNNFTVVTHSRMRAVESGLI